MSKVIDLKGQRFGRLTVIERDGSSKSGHAKWRCRCDCGNECVVRGRELRNGDTVSCGCYHREMTSKRLFHDLTGQKFGRLTVIEHVETNQHGVRWRCKCDCGNECIVYATHLRGGTTQSCGCLSSEKVSERFVNDLTGRRFGRLTVIERAGSASDKHARWRCRCDCGNEIVVVSSSLVRGFTKSCGCIGKSRGEFYVESYLKGKKFNFFVQHRYKGLTGIGGGHLSYDFVLRHPSYGAILIEYQGIQHYELSTGIFAKDGRFGYQQEHDDRKRQAAELLGYPLIEVPYTYDTQEKVNQYLDDALIPLLQRPRDEWEYVEQNAE